MTAGKGRMDITMGGFTVNGCGATDSFYPVKDLGVFHCPSCGQTRTLCLMEVKRKIRVLYIPTVSISTKYAVACKSCRNGYYITEQQKDDLLYDHSEVEITSEGAILHKKGKPEVIDVQEPEERSAPEPARRRFCGRCGGRLDEQTGLCPVCDGAESTVKVQKKEFGRENVGQSLAGKPSRKICPACGLLFSADKTVCPVCGSGLTQRQ